MKKLLTIGILIIVLMVFLLIGCGQECEESTIKNDGSGAQLYCYNDEWIMIKSIIPLTCEGDEMIVDPAGNVYQCKDGSFSFISSTEKSLPETTLEDPIAKLKKLKEENIDWSKPVFERPTVPTVPAETQEDSDLPGIPSAEDIDWSKPVFERPTVPEDIAETETLTETEENNLLDIPDSEDIDWSEPVFERPTI